MDLSGPTALHTLSYAAKPFCTVMMSVSGLTRGVISFRSAGILYDFVVSSRIGENCCTSSRAEQLIGELIYRLLSEMMLKPTSRSCHSAAPREIILGRIA